MSRVIDRSSDVDHSRLGLSLSCNRRQASNAFAAFLCAIEYSGDDILSCLFTCPTCEQSLPDGTSRMRAVIMDGTATGILGPLPAYHRPALTIDAAERTAPIQFLFGPHNLRLFLSRLFKADGKARLDGSFEVENPATGICQDFIKRVTPNLNSSTTVVSGAFMNFVRLIFTDSSMATFTAPISSRASGSTNTGTSNTALVHAMPVTNLRGSLCNFALTLTATSVAIFNAKFRSVEGKISCGSSNCATDRATRTPAIVSRTLMYCIPTPISFILQAVQDEASEL